jgi:hypothetical protein
MGLLAVAAVVGPVFLAACSLFLVGVAANSQGAFFASFLFLFVSLASGAGLSLLYRWCFARPATAGGALLCSCAVGVWLLSEPLLLLSFAELIRGDFGSQGVFLQVLVETGLFVALVCAVVMAGALVIELPFRFLAPQQPFLDDGCFRALRWIGSVVVVVIGSVLIREEGLSRLGALLRRLVA